MAKQKIKKTGEELFLEYYSELYGERFQNLKESLSLESDYFSLQYDSNSKTYFLDSGSVLAALALPLENANEILYKIIQECNLDFEKIIKYARETKSKVAINKIIALAR